MRKSYYSSSGPSRGSYYASKRPRSPSPISRSPISPAPKRPPPPPPPPVSALSPISSASNITPPEISAVREISDPRKAQVPAAADSNFRCQCARPAEEIIFPGGLPRFVQEGGARKDVSLQIKAQDGLTLETLPGIGNFPRFPTGAACRQSWLPGCRVLLLQELPQELRIGNIWRNFVEISAFPGLVRAELLSFETLGLSSPSSGAGAAGLDAAGLLVFGDEISARNVFLQREISAYGVDLTVTPDPHFFRTLQLASSAIFARQPRRSAPTSPATPDDSAPRFGGGLSRRAKVVAAGARQALRVASEAGADEDFWRSRGAHGWDAASQPGLATVRFPRAPLRDACLVYVPVPVRILDAAELVISMTESGAVAVVETLAQEDQLFAPLDDFR